jgi:NAD(P)-dependent dehydrogenase (short-subunit alcohol dehydrogenase family)
MMDKRTLTQDGFEMVFTANHLSHFLLTNLLLPDLEKTKYVVALAFLRFFVDLML